MLKESARLIAYRRLAVEILVTAGTFLLAHQLRSHVLPRVIPSVFPLGLYPIGDYLPLLAVVLVVWATLLAVQRLHRPDRVMPLRLEVIRSAQVPLVGALLIAAVSYLFRLDFVSRPFVVLFALTNAVALGVLRIVERRTALGRRLLEAPERVVVIVGCGPEAIRMARLVTSSVAWGFTLHGLVDVEDSGRTAVEGFPVVATGTTLSAVLTREIIDEVVLAVPIRQLGELEPLLLRCQELGIRVRVALQPFPHLSPRLTVDVLEGMPLVTFATMPTDPLPLSAKRLTDLVLATVALLASLPLWLVAAVAIRATSHGPILFRQVRCGLGGRRFVLYKFRTMVEGAESRRAEVAHLNEIPDGPVFKTRRDPRITGVGRWLRRWSLDELPQLLNVLRGEMSLVGPRPPIPDEVAEYEPWQRRRLAMKPGLTGLWQVSGRAQLDFATWMELDLAYIDHWSLWLDFKILMKTLPAVLGGRGAA